jgi:putative oxidoreductase
MNAIRRWLSPHSDRLYALMRIVVAFVYFCHGTQKLFGWPQGQTVYGKPLLVTAGVIEVFLGFLIIVGFQTSLVAFICSGEMAAAYFIVHLPQGFLPIVSHGELPVLFCFVFLYVASRGAGPWSIDSLLSRKSSA